MSFSGGTHSSNNNNNNNGRNSMWRIPFLVFRLANISDSNGPGRKRLDKVELMSDKTKNRRFKELDDKISDVVGIIVALLSWSLFFAIRSDSTR